MTARILLIAALALIAFASPASATKATIDPELEKQEQEYERLLKNAEAEFWSLKLRLERDRNDREQRLATAKADYEKAQSGASTGGVKDRAVDHRNITSHRADRALEKYHSELERALTGVDSARVALDRVEARVSQYRAALEVLRRRARGTTQSPGTAPSIPDSSSTRTPITGALDTGKHLRT